MSTQQYTVSMLQTDCRRMLLQHSDPKVVKAVQENPSIHDWVVESTVRNWSDLPPPKMGGQKNDWKRQYKRRLATVKQKVTDEASNNWKIYLGVGAGMILFLTGGLGYVLLIVIGAVFAWCIEDYLDNHYKITQARMSAGYV